MHKADGSTWDRYMKEQDFYADLVAIYREIEDIFVDLVLVSVEVFHEGLDAALVLVDVLLAGPLVLQFDANA